MSGLASTFGSAAPGSAARTILRIGWAVAPGSRGRAERIAIREHSARGAVQNAHTCLCQISTEHRPADPPTKPPQPGPFEGCLYSLLGEDPPRRDHRHYVED
jgi:hypothetical protein